MAGMFRLFPVLFLLVSCSNSADMHETRFIMGTLVEFTVADADPELAENAIRQAAEEMQRIDDMFTIYRERDNSVKRFNRSRPGTSVRLDNEVARILSLALAIQQESNGAFNPALGRLNRLWGFSMEPLPSHPPSEDAIRASIPPAGCIRKDGNEWSRTSERCELDFGAIAKGYAIDRGIAVLRRAGIQHAIINAGGDIRVIGSHHGKPWRIGLRHPRSAGDVLGTIEVKGDVSIVTSGDYERFYIDRGRRYHHILDPESGHPAALSQSATVIAETATLADAWSTALFVLGPTGLKLLERRQMPALVVDRRGRLHVNGPMRAIFQPAS
ncbi:MAG: FAD:protein FMN transferase [Alphaproteobacteria bacterium]|nr:MAG: FAD:protein FMN transferase [Alphaproteobacteria bacterium]